MSEKQICPICGSGGLIRATKNVVHTYKGHKATIRQPGLWCTNCGEGILRGPDLKATEKQLHDLKAKAENLLPSNEIVEIRRRLKLTQKKMAKYFGGGPNAFSRYERGEALQPRAADLLLRLLREDPKLLKRIEKLTHPQMPKRSAHK